MVYKLYLNKATFLIEVSLIYNVVLVSSVLNKAIFNQNKKDEMPHPHMPQSVHLET